MHPSLRSLAVPDSSYRFLGHVIYFRQALKPRLPLPLPLPLPLRLPLLPLPLSPLIFSHASADTTKRDLGAGVREPDEGGPNQEQKRFGYFCCSSKVTRCKSGTDISLTSDNGYTHNHRFVTKRQKNGTPLAAFTSHSGNPLPLFWHHPHLIP
jgi:hypothetical protein